MVSVVKSSVASPVRHGGVVTVIDQQAVTELCPMFLTASLGRNCVLKQLDNREFPQVFYLHDSRIISCHWVGLKEGHLT